jgi:DNA-binding CsgD family transcriptional regulator
MKSLSTHYKVVSVKELPSRLEEGYRMCGNPLSYEQAGETVAYQPVVGRYYDGQFAEEGASLTLLQRQLLYYLRMGLEVKEIAMKLNFNRSTTSYHLRKLRKKVGCSNNIELLFILGSSPL